MRIAALRGEFPVVDRLAYLNAGTDGPVPRRAVEAARRELERQAADGRAHAHVEQRAELATRLRSAYAGLLGCAPADVALASSTSDGVATVIAALPLERGDEIVTSDEEHPGLVGALQAARDLRGATVRMVPLAEVPDAVGPRTRLVACCHVGWVSGALAPATLAEVDVPVLLDGAQGAGAVPVDVGALGCAAYAGSGQKWLCGPDGTGMLYVAPWFRDQIPPTRRTFEAFADPLGGLDAPLHDDARRYDTPSRPAEGNAFALASIELLEAAGWEAVHGRGVELAGELAERLAGRGREVAPRAATTLVSWRCEDAEAERRALAARGVVVRDIPGRGLLRASVGAWNDEDDLERLLADGP